MPLQIICSDITKVECDAIVNAANSSLLGGGGVDGAIHRAAGPGLLEECRTLGGCLPGHSKITKAYSLPAKYVIHTVGPVWQGGHSGEEALLYSCYATALDLAQEYSCKSVAFPLISSGAYGYPWNDALRVARNSINAFSGIGDMQVYIVLFDRSIRVTERRLYEDLNRFIESTQAEYNYRETQANIVSEPIRPVFNSTVPFREESTILCEAPPIPGQKAKRKPHFPKPDFKRKERKAEKEQTTVEPIPSAGQNFEPDVDKQYKYCSACGAKMPPGYMFCAKCGALNSAGSDNQELKTNFQAPTIIPGCFGASMPDAYDESETTDKQELSFEEYTKKFLLDETFTQSLLKLIDKSGMTDAECYKKANIDRRHFSKIRSDINYSPKKQTVLALCIALELNLNETKDLLMKAGYALSHSNKFDVIIEYFIINNDFDITKINEALFDFDLPLLA